MIKAKLIADAGSTKVDWILLAENGKIIGKYTSEGINALLSEAEDIADLMAEVRKNFDSEIEYSEIHYYGAGCATDRVNTRMTEIISKAWDSNNVKVYSDLLGAAHALFGNKRGIACILGTGSNSCLYDGENIEVNVPSLGYILGDEGSGAALGKRLVSDAFKGHLPRIVREAFMEEYNMTLADILDKVYRTSAPNKFLASLVPFIKKNIWNPYIYSLVRQELTSFIKRNVAMYPGAHSLPMGFIGSIAVIFEDILREAANDLGYSVDKVVKTPMEGLVAYHNYETV